MIKGCIFNLIDVVLKEVSNVDDLDPKFVTPDHLVDGFLVFLKELKNKGIQIAVVSHNPLLKEILDKILSYPLILLRIPVSLVREMDFSLSIPQPVQQRSTIV